MAFLACIFANIKTLQYCNVETFIVFRASTPVVIGAALALTLTLAAPLCRLHLHGHARPIPPSLLTLLLATGVADWLFLGRELPNARSRRRTAPHAPHAQHAPHAPRRARSLHASRQSLSPCSVPLLWQPLDARPRRGCWLVHVHGRIVRCPWLPVRPHPRPAPPPHSPRLAPSPRTPASQLFALPRPASAHLAPPRPPSHHLAPPRAARLGRWVAL